MIQLADIGQPERPFRWTTERYIALVESGIVPETRGIELIDGQIIESMPQGELHNFIFMALQRVFAAAGAFEHGLTVQPTVNIRDGDTYDPEFAFLRPEAVMSEHLPCASDVTMIIEVAVTSKKYDLGAKKQGYAAAGIPLYWVVDGLTRGVWVHRGPVSGSYSSETFVAGDQELEVPRLGRAIDLKRIFPSG